MSDGGRESGRDSESSSRKSKASGGDDFGRAISRIAVAQVCESVGFQSIQGSALDALSDVAIRYICDLGKTSQFYANLSGRTESNVFDIIQGLEDLGSSHGFPGASDIHRCLIRSGVVREMTQYVSTSEEVPFARPVPRFPIVRHRKLVPSFAQIGETPPGTHMPDWLPALPDPHTYIQTPVWSERKLELKEDKIEQARQRRKAERSLLSLQQRLAGNDAVVRIPTDEGDAGKGKQAAEAADVNPFLAPPLPFGEKEVSPLVLPDETAVEKKVSIVKTFEPFIEAMKAEGLDPGDCENTFLPSKRPTVHFKLALDKKTLATPIYFAAPGSGENASLFLRDDEKNDKKRRAKLILKESMENPQELHQL